MGSVDVYYFDASQAGPTDIEAEWTADADAFDGSDTTKASTAGGYTGWLSGVGTTAPTSGESINYVRVRYKANIPGISVSFRVWEDSVGGTILYNDPSITAWGTPTLYPWITLLAPSGGWTWQKVQDLAVGATGASGDVIEMYIFEVQVTSGHLPHVYEEKNDVYAHNNASFTTAHTLAGTSLTADTKYLLIARALVGSDNATDKVGIRVETADDSNLATKSDSLYEMMQTSQPGAYKSWDFIHSFTTDATPADVNLQTSIAGGSIVYADQMSLFALDLDQFGYEEEAWATPDAGEVAEIKGSTGDSEAVSLRFTPRADGPLEELWIEIKDGFITSDEYYCEIHESSPTGTLLGTSDYKDATGPQSSYNDEAMIFSDPRPQLTAGTEYHAVFERTGVWQDVDFLILGTSTTQGAGQELIQNRDSGSWSNGTTYGILRWKSFGRYLETILPATGATTVGHMGGIASDPLGVGIEWIIAGSMKYGVASTGRTFTFKIDAGNDGEFLNETQIEETEEGEDTSEERVFAGVVRHNAPINTVNVSLAKSHETNANTTFEGGYVVALPFLAFADVKYVYNQGTQAITSEATIATTGSYTPTVDGQHLIIGSTGTSVGTADGAELQLHLEDGTTETRTGDSTPTHDQGWDVAKDAEGAHTMQLIDVSGATTYNLRATGGTWTAEHRWLWAINLNEPLPPPAYPPFPTRVLRKRHSPTARM